jgi:hypothetical protein
MKGRDNRKPSENSTDWPQVSKHPALRATLFAKEGRGNGQREALARPGERQAEGYAKSCDKGKKEKTKRLNEQ